MCEVTSLCRRYFVISTRGYLEKNLNESKGLC